MDVPAAAQEALRLLHATVVKGDDCEVGAISISVPFLYPVDQHRYSDVWNCWQLQMRLATAAAKRLPCCRISSALAQTQLATQHPPQVWRT